MALNRKPLPREARNLSGGFVTVAMYQGLSCKERYVHRIVRRSARECEQLSRLRQQGAPPVTTARDKVQLALPVPPLQFVTHRPGHSRAPSPANPR